MHTDCMYVCFKTFLLTPPLHQHTCQCASLTQTLTLHYAARSVIHAQTGSAPPPQKKGDSQLPDATAPDPEHQHQRSQHLQAQLQLQRQRHQYPVPHRPTSDRQGVAGPGDDEVQVARQFRVQTREVEAVVVTVAAVAAAGVEATIETVAIAVVQVVVAVVLEVAVPVGQLQVPMETHR